MHFIAIALAVVLIGAGTYFFMSSDSESPSETATSSVQENRVEDTDPNIDETSEEALDEGNENNDEEEQAVGDTSTYVDGTYTRDGTYFSPAGEESVTVSLTLEDDVVVGAEFVGNATNPGSVTNQDKFAAGYKEEVVGKSIDEISLDVVNGSSLTPEGFMDAVNQIKSEAQQS